MKYIHELEAWSLPGLLLHPEYSKTTLQEEMWREGVPKNVFLGISAIPDKIDCENLKFLIHSGELKENEFMEFCVIHKLPETSESEESSAKFLEYKKGRCLAWIHLPTDSGADVLSKIKKILQIHGHIIIDPRNMSLLI
ncbi:MULTISPECIES: hypothetical protein [Acidovorax]|uniref:hypothetical protein n=1 Tax=Acidovorax TaxID=12916 RepID=UPI001111F795|nr:MULTISPECIES: hypothetical protein [Acidovorax]